MATSDASARVEAVWRVESTRLIAALVRITGDVALAEDLAQDALVAALDQWPAQGIPASPGAWLMTVAKRRAVDVFRRSAAQGSAYRGVADGLTEAVPDVADAVDRLDDDVLRLMFVCCHPVLSDDAQVTLTLKLIAGLSVAEIARAFLTRPPTISARLTRAKKALADVGAGLDEVAGPDREDRLSAVSKAIYLLFNEGYTATAGEDLLRPDLCAEALRLGRMVAHLVPSDAEIAGLVALMEFQHSRAATRVGPSGEPVLLPDQDRSRWDRVLIRRGATELARAQHLVRQRRESPGPYVLQAMIASHHAQASSHDNTDWARIAGLYEQLAIVTGSVVVELNRAVALAMWQGPAVGLGLIDQLADVPGLATYHLLPAVRGDLLARLGRTREARAEFERAASLTSNEQERRMLLRRASGSD